MVKIKQDVEELGLKKSDMNDMQEDRETISLFKGNEKPKRRKKGFKSLIR